MKLTVSMLALSAVGSGCQPSSPAAQPAKIELPPAVQRSSPAAPEALPVSPGGPQSAVTLVKPADLAGSFALEPPPVSADVQQAVLDTAAQTAWAFVRHNYQENTGLVAANETYQYVTAWDIGSTLAAFYAARGLGYISADEYHHRMTRALQMLATMPLYDGKAFNKFYDSKSASMIDRNQHRTNAGVGWSALDVGRLLAVLRFVGDGDPALGPLAQQVVNRLSFRDMIDGGYLQGRDLDPRTGKPGSYQEGRLGYEQYAAEGYAAWGQRADKALDFGANGRFVTVDGYLIPADKRGDDLMTSEPFVLMGMELGWHTPQWREYAFRVFDAQRQRYQKTGVVTMLSEDAIPEPPAYFYYYLLYHDGKPFVVTAPGGAQAPDHVRWVSTKAAFGWHALLPSAYTWLAIQSVRPALERNRGWTGGVYEGTKRSTLASNLNTAAIVLEAALYAKRKCPFVDRSCSGGLGN